MPSAAVERAAVDSPRLCSPIVQRVAHTTSISLSGLRTWYQEPSHPHDSTLRMKTWYARMYTPYGWQRRDSAWGNRSGISWRSTATIQRWCYWEACMKVSRIQARKGEHELVQHVCSKPCLLN